MNKICLVIIYNHNFEKNIPILNRIYAGRFSDVYHVMPFYQGDDPHVIGVYECSFQFQGYVTQAAHRFINDKYSHYVFVADDMVIHPDLNEGNIIQKLKLDDDTALADDIRIVTDERFAKWHWGRSSTLNLNSKSNACEGMKYLPSIEVAEEAFKRCGLDCQQGVSFKLYDLYRKISSRRYLTSWLSLIERAYRCFSSHEKTYPLAYGYSDIMIVPAKTFGKFCHVCGILAGMRVFVEVAIPTALVLTSKKLVTARQIGLDGERGIDNYADRERFEKSCGMSYRKLLELFPQNYLYIHPVKLSKWKDLP